MSTIASSTEAANAIQSRPSEATAPAAPAAPDFATSFDPILRDFLNPSLTLADVATRTGTPLLKLVEYFNRPFVQDAIRAVLAATQARAEMLAQAGIHMVVKTQYLAIQECERLTAEQPITAATPPTNLAARARIREQARKAASTLLAMAKPKSGTKSATTASSPPASQNIKNPSPRGPATDPSSTPVAAPAAPAPRNPDLPQHVPRAA